MHILPKGWIHPFRLHICHFCSSFSQFWNSLPKILFWKISLIILCVLSSCGTWDKRWKVATKQNDSNELCVLLKISTSISREGCLVMEKLFCWPHLFSSVFVRPPDSFSGFLQDFLPQSFFLNWGCSNLTHLPRRPKKLNIMIKVGSVLTSCMIGFRLRESIWAYMIYALNVILWRFCIMLLFSVKVSCLLCRYINYCFIQFTVEKFGLLDIVGALCLLAYMSSRQLRKCTKFHIRASH